MELIGTIVEIKDEQEISASFKKREFVIAVTEGTHTQEIILELHQDRVDIIDPYGIGEEIKCAINIRGKRFVKAGQDDRFYNTIICWKIERV